MIGDLLKGVALSLLLIFSVGPAVFTIIKQSINNGKHGGFSYVAGIWLSDLVLVILSNAFSELVTTLLDHKKMIGLAGSIFLISMGLFYLIFKKVKMRTEQEAAVKLSTGTFTKLLLAGFLMNTLNPAVIAFWLTTATTIAVSHTVEERYIIFITCLACNSGADLLKVILAGKLRNKLTDKNIALITKISGLILAVFGVVLLLGVLYSAARH
jgi:threonine/homoserine/homoserine lactone efflux protein